MADLSQLKAHTSELHLVIPGTKQRIGLMLELQQLSSPACEAVQEKNVEAQRKIAEEHGEIPKDVLQAHAVELYASSVVAWKWDKDADWQGKQLDFTPENVAKVLSVDAIFDQVYMAHRETRRFFAGFVKK